MPEPSFTSIIGGLGTTEADKRRSSIGVCSYVIGVATFVAGAVWAACSITRALSVAYEGKLEITTSIAILYGAKALLIAVIEAFALAMIRAAERLTMPLANYMQVVEAESSAKGKGADTDKALDIVKRLLDLVQQGTEIGNKAGD